MSDADRPAPMALAGVRVLDLSRVLAGPWCTQTLADLGADVIKIENPTDGGEIGRHVGPRMFGPNDSQFYQAFNRNKRSITLNLKHPEGMALFRQLVAGADAVLDNLRGDLPEKLGLDYGLRLPAQEVKPGSGEAHKRQCLEALALC